MPQGAVVVPAAVVNATAIEPAFSLSQRLTLAVAASSFWLALSFSFSTHLVPAAFALARPVTPFSTAVIKSSLPPLHPYSPTTTSNLLPWSPFCRTLYILPPARPASLPHQAARLLQGNSEPTSSLSPLSSSSWSTLLTSTAAHT